MKANLLVFSDEGNTEFLEQLITFNIRPNFCLAMQEINTITFLSLNSSIPEITKYLDSSTIVAVGYCEETCYRNIKIAINNFYNSNIIRTPFGEFCKNGNRFCSIVDLSAQNINLDPAVLRVLYDTEQTLTLSLFGIDKFELTGALRSVDFINNFDCALCSTFGDIRLTFTPINEVGKQHMDDFLRCMYQRFNEFIYNDEGKNLVECVSELVGIRKQYFALYDLITDGFADEKLKNIPKVCEYLVPITDSDFEYLNSVDSASGILKKYNLDFLILALGNFNSARILVIDENNIKRYEYSVSKERKYNEFYVFNLILSKIFNKLRKNTSYF